MPIKHRYYAVENAPPEELVDAADWNDTHVVTPNVTSGNGIPAASYPAGQVSVGDYYINNSSPNVSSAFYQKWICVKVTNQGATDAIDWVAVNDGGNLKLVFDSNSGLTQPDPASYIDTGAQVNIRGIPQIEFINSNGQSAGYAGHLKAQANNIAFQAQPNNTMLIGFTGGGTGGISGQVNNGTAQTIQAINLVGANSGSFSTVGATTTLNVNGPYATNSPAYPPDFPAIVGNWTTFNANQNLKCALDATDSTILNVDSYFNGRSQGNTVGNNNFFTDVNANNGITAAVNSQNNQLLDLNVALTAQNSGNLASGSYYQINLAQGLSGSVDSGNTTLTISPNIRASGNGITTTDNFNAINIGGGLNASITTGSSKALNLATNFLSYNDTTPIGVWNKITFDPSTNITAGLGTGSNITNLTLVSDGIPTTGTTGAKSAFNKLALGTGINGSITSTATTAGFINTLTLTASGGSGGLSWQESGVAQSGIVNTLNIGANLFANYTATGNVLTVNAGTEGQGFAIPLLLVLSNSPNIGVITYAVPYFQEASTGIALNTFNIDVNYTSANQDTWPAAFISAWNTGLNGLTDAVAGQTVTNTGGVNGRCYLTTNPPVKANSLTQAQITTYFNNAGNAFPNSYCITDMDIDTSLPNLYPFIVGNNTVIGIVNAINVGGNTLTGNLTLTNGTSQNIVLASSTTSRTISIDITQSPQFQHIDTLTPKVSSYTMDTANVVSIGSSTDTPLPFSADYKNSGCFLSRATNQLFSGAYGFGLLVGDVFYNSSSFFDIYINVSGMISWGSNGTGIRIVYIKRCTTTNISNNSWAVGDNTQRVYQNNVVPLSSPDLAINPVSATIKLGAITNGVYQGIVFVGYQTAGTPINVGASGSGESLGYSTRLTFVEVV